MKQKLNREMLDRMQKDPTNWRGPFYYNRHDHRLFVPKREPLLGYTLNLANPYGYVMIIAIVAGIFLVSLL